MQDNRILNVSEDTSLGNVEIAPEVIEVIAGIAANEVKGVAQMRGNFASNVTERFGKKNHGKGIKVELTDKGIKIDTYSVLEYGVSIPTVAQQIQDNIRQALKNMTALEIEEVNVHIVAVQIDTKEEEGSPEEV